MGNVPYTMTLVNHDSGCTYQVERLARSPGVFARGFRLTLAGWEPVRPVCHVHQLPDGRHECGCVYWTKHRECEHTRLLTAVGLFDAPVTPGELYDAGYFDEDDFDIDIDWNSP